MSVSDLPNLLRRAVREADPHWWLAADLRRAADEIERLERERDDVVRLLADVRPSTCDHVHHRRADYHAAGEACPVLVRVDAVLQQRGND